MKLEVGKYYRTRNGDKVFLCETEEGGCAGFGKPLGLYLPDGKFGYMENGRHRCASTDLDIISEWTDKPEVGPVRTVTTTRQEIVPGVYGNVVVESRVNGFRIKMTEAFYCDPEDLTAAIATLTAIRDAMQANAAA